MYTRTWLPSLTKITLWFGFVTSQIEYHAASTVPYQGICIRDTSNLKIDDDSDTSLGFKQIPSIDARGQVDYMDMVGSSTVFVDKSLLIKRILDTKEKVILINCPSRTGKSINLSMLRAFFEIRVKGLEKRILPKNETSTYKFFTTGLVTKFTKMTSYRNFGYFDSPLQYKGNILNKKVEKYAPHKHWEYESLNQSAWDTYKTPPAISKHQNIIDQHLGEYPVIYLNLIPDLLFSIPDIYKNLKMVVGELFRQNFFLKLGMLEVIKNNHTSEKEKEIAQKNLHLFNYYESQLLKPDSKCNLTAAKLETSVLNLSKMLYEHFGKPVIILMDEYIAPLENYLIKKPECDQKTETECQTKVNSQIEVLRNFMRNTLAENQYLKKSVLTGVLSVNKNDLFANITDYVHYNAIDNDFQEFYGFTENEVQALFDHFQITKQLANDARTFYKGYSWKRSTNLTMYNAWSMVNFLNTKKIDEYWAMYTMTSSKMGDWINIEKFANVLRPSIKGNEMMIDFVEAEYNNRDLIISTMAQPNANISQKATDCILSIFCEYGFLTNSNRQFHQNNINNNSIWVRIPNEEVRQRFQKGCWIVA